MAVDAVDYATEGQIDGVVACKMLEAAGLEPGASYPAGGKSRLDPRIQRYNAAARWTPWLVLRDQDADGCPPVLITKLAPRRAPLLCLRIVPHALEAWLMGDQEAFADFFRISMAAVSPHPEQIARPKQCLVDLVRNSRSPGLIREMVPRRGSGISVGPNYEGVMTEFARDHWRIDRAEKTCPALDRALYRLAELKNRLEN